jgi:hypothetical protein
MCQEGIEENHLDANDKDITDACRDVQTSLNQKTEVGSLRRSGNFNNSASKWPNGDLPIQGTNFTLAATEMLRARNIIRVPSLQVRGPQQ